MAGRRKDERTIQMMRTFELYRFGYGYDLYQIAELNQIHYSTVLSHLDEIAEQLGCSRDDLLVEPSKSGYRAVYNGNLREVPPLDVEGLKGDIKDLKSRALAVLERVDKVIAEGEAIELITEADFVSEGEKKEQEA